ncbi:MAG TPA: Gfo/Idh/MocA family oxidoreductase [Terriglobia bacterium]|jgi:predicted dehydrogenase|nr:Gfo/Idh/MocA family oxidoreductase [Terriglobia bacterium]
METLDPIRVAVIGVGEHGRHHARAFRDLQQANLVGVYDARPERAEAMSVELGCVAFGSLEQALASVQAVSVVIPTTAHAEVVHRCFDAGIDVLVEKPISRTADEAADLVERSEREQRILQVGHLERFNPGVVAAKKVTRNPMFFEVHRLGVFSSRSLDVDVVFDLMIHDLDLLLWMVESPVSDVRAVGLPVLSDKVDIANARVEFANGAVANLTASRASTERIRKFRYFQPSEYISIDFARRDALVISVDRTGTAPEIGFRKLETKPGDPLRSELSAFLESVASRRQPPVDGRAGMAALALAERVMNCIEEHAARVQVHLGSRATGQPGES